VSSATRSDARTGIVVFLHIGFTYLPVFLAAALGPSLWVVAFWLWFGLAKNGLINLMHECAHSLCFRRKWANEALGGLVLAPLVLTQFEEYRDRHWVHHRSLGTLSDPKIVYRTNVRGWSAVALFFRCLAGLEALRRLTETPVQPLAKSRAKHSVFSLRFVAIHTIFLACLGGVAVLFQPDLVRSIIAVATAYGFVYGYGLTSITVFAAAMRAIAEHQIDSGQCRREGDAALRNFRCNPITWMLFGAYGFSDHATHHSRPDVPYYQLPAITSTLSSNDEAFVPHRGYVTTFLRLVLGKEARAASITRGASL